MQRQFFYLAKDEPKEGEMAMMKLKPALIACALLSFVFFINGCCDYNPMDPESGCNDGQFCNGEEVCTPIEWLVDIAVCTPGPPPCTGDCDEATDSCIASEECWTFEDCEDGDLCTLDECLTDNTCFWLPAIFCPVGETCNPDTGECE
jgi:hypothetical protein